MKFSESLVILDCLPGSSLNWTSALEQAEKISTSKRKILWQLELGLESPFFPFEDEFRFQTLGVALRQFAQEVWPKFHEHSAGIILYRGTADFSAFFSWTERQKANYTSWLTEQSSVDDFQTRRLFCLETAAIYFQMLAHKLPDEATIFLLLDFSPMTSISDALTVLSKDRLEHFFLAAKGKETFRDGWRWDELSLSQYRIKSATGIVFPKVPCDFDAVLKTYPSSKVLFETSLSEEWGEIDRIVTISGTLSPQGKRMLQGFAAAGGEIIFHKK